MMERNILINYTGRTGGGAAHAYEMAKGLIDAGANVYAIVSRQADNYSAWTGLPLKKLYSIDTYTNKKEFICSTLKFILWKRKEIREEFKSIKLSAVYVPMGTYWSYLISCQFKGVPVYYTIHDPELHSGESIFNRLFLSITKREIVKAAKVITLSRCFVNMIERNYGVSRENILVIPQSAFWEYKKNSNIKRLVDYDGGKINFLFFGRIEKYKGLDILLAAYSRLEKEFLDGVSLTIAGKGNIDEYSGAINQLKNIKVLNFMIPDNDIVGLFAGENVVTVLPYKDATQSGVINTAFMFDSLVIATDTGALSYQLDNGKYGILVRPNSINELYSAMKKVTMNIDRCEKYKNNASAYINNLHWDKLARKLIDAVDCFD